MSPDGSSSVQQTRARRPRVPLWVGYLVVGLLASLVYVGLPWGGSAQAVVFALLQFSVVGALVVGIRRHRPERAAIWRLMIAGQILYTLGNLVWYLVPTLIGYRIWPGVATLASWLYIPGYMMLLAGLWLLVRARRGSDTAALIDTMIVTLGIGVLSWVFLMAPYAREPGLSAVERAVTLTYPLVDLLLLGVVVAMAFLPGARRAAFWLLGASLVCQFVTDTIYAMLTLSGEFVFGRPYFAGWALFFVLLGAAALHPSMRTLTEPCEERAPALARTRLGFLAAAAIVPSLILMVESLNRSYHNVTIVAAVSALLFLLVLARLARVMKDMVEHRRSREALAASRDQALEASRMKSAFLATMSHEIRTPMNAVIGMAGLLMDTDLDDKQRQYVAGVRSGGEALLSIINEILDFSKIESGKMTLEESDFDLEQVVEGVADLLSETARSKGLSVFSYCDPDIPRPLRGDVGKLHQVLLNLLSNAVKFTDEGETAVRATLEADGPSDLLVRFEVTDTGIGISESDRQRLFQPFVQLDDSTTRRHGGTGLGLAISKQLVELMGGEIGVSSASGAGSTFWFTARAQRSRAVGEPRRLQALARRRVLLIDGDPTNRLLLLHQMTAWGMRPRGMVDNEAALHQLRAARDEGDPFDIVVADTCSPQIDGLALLAAIVGDPSLVGTKVALQVCSEADEQLEGARQAGVEAVLRKPVRQSQLYDLLIRLLTPDRGSAEPERAEDRAIADRPRGHVLLVEDNAANQLVGAAIVRKLGFRADVVANGKEALEVLALRGYDAVLMDCYMPVMDGYDATRMIREREADGRRTPIIAMTAGAMPEDQKRCFAAGMDEYVTKPVRLEDLSAVLDRWIVPASPGEDARPPAAAAGAAGGGEEAIDASRWAVLVDLVGGDTRLLSTIIDTFLADAPRRLEDLRSAAASGDQETALRAVHTLRGSAANIGAVRLSQRCGEVEGQAQRGEMEAVHSAVDAISDELDRLRQALEANPVEKRSRPVARAPQPTP